MITEKDRELTKLRNAFESLNSSTQSLMEAYDGLKQDTARLSSNLQESQSFLSDILNSLNCGVIVANITGEIILENQEAIRLNVSQEKLTTRWLQKISELEREKPAKKIKIDWDASEGRKLTISASKLQRKEAEETETYILIVEDVTEVVRLRKQSTRSNRFAAIGKIAAGMAHEIRNPLGGMQIFTSLLRRELGEDKGKQKMLGHIDTGIHAINNVVSNVLLFTKEPRPAKQQFDLKKLIIDTLEFAGYVFEQNNIDVTSDFPETGLMILADPNLIRQALLNLIHNATQAMPDGGKFHIKIEEVEKPGGKLCVDIICKDTGPGIPKDIRDKIFDPLFTTKDSGAGLGLAIVSQIAHAHGGYIDILNTGESGAGFIISLPMES